MSYLYKRGRGASRRVMHLCLHDPRDGQPLMIPMCCTRLIGFNTTSNVPWGRPVCKRCLETLAARSPRGEDSTQ